MGESQDRRINLARPGRACVPPFWARGPHLQTIAANYLPSPAPALPESLARGLEERPVDICSRWAMQVGTALGATLSCEAESMFARIPRGGPAR